MANQAQNPSQAAAQETRYFDLHTTGIGYLNRVRWVNIDRGGRKAKPFLACTISALRGSSEEIDYTYFDLKVSGQDSIERIDSLLPYVEKNRKVLVRFCIGDIYPHLYERNARDQRGQPTGGKEWAALIKGRLIRIDSVKVDGKLLYRREKGEGQAQGDAPSAPAETADQQSAPQPKPQPAAASFADKPASASSPDTGKAVMSSYEDDDDIPF